MTIIIVSHDIASTAAIADTLWIMGREQKEDGSFIPGAYIKHTFDLAQLGLAWADSSHSNPAFSQLVHEVRTLFPTL
jgi:polar amino acid transport system ATP-binding protein/sulfate transport system ATP-binding protein